MKLKKCQQIVNANSTEQQVTQIKKWNNKTYLCECKSYRKYKNYYIWNASTSTCDNSKYLKSIADTLVISCDEIIYAMDIVSTKMTNDLATSTVSINCHNKKVRYNIDSYILHTVLLVIILLLLIITIICCHYAKHR